MNNNQNQNGSSSRAIIQNILISAIIDEITSPPPNSEYVRDEQASGDAIEAPAIYAGKEHEPYPCDTDADCRWGWTCQSRDSFDQTTCLP
jgi:hypothetical protein